MRIILASNSPRRRELLAGCGVEFEVFTADINESLPIKKPKKFVSAVSELKAREALKSFENEADALIIAADTVVNIDNLILGKPADEKQAYEMIKRLSGRFHKVYTGICFVRVKNRAVKFKKDICCTKVKFKKLSEEKIKDYISTEEPYDKAGAYAVQGLAGEFIGKISGDYENIVGLSTKRAMKILIKIN